MKYTLAENLLRFGGKNLTKSNKRRLTNYALKEQILPPANGIWTDYKKLTKYISEQELTNLQKLGDRTPGVKNYGTTSTGYIFKAEGQEGTSGSNRDHTNIAIYTIGNGYGYPVAAMVATGGLTNLRSSDWKLGKDEFYLVNKPMEAWPGAVEDSIETTWPMNVAAAFNSIYVGMDVKLFEIILKQVKVRAAEWKAGLQKIIASKGKHYSAKTFNQKVLTVIKDPNALALYNIIKPS